MVNKSFRHQSLLMDRSKECWILGALAEELLVFLNDSYCVVDQVCFRGVYLADSVRSRDVDRHACCHWNCDVTAIINNLNSGHIRLRLIVYRYSGRSELGFHISDNLAKSCHELLSCSARLLACDLFVGPSRVVGDIRIA